jgi:hypothetical protein
MKDHSPIITAESRFLDHGKDLISLSPRRASPTASVYSAIIIASAAILLPLLAFSMISEFSGRLLVVALVGGAAAAIAMNYSSGAEHLESRDGWRPATLYVSGPCTSFINRGYLARGYHLITFSSAGNSFTVHRYFGFMTIAAMFIP